jgi:hypothetical protein
MDTTGCEASRTAQGLTGAWLQFSCDVGLQKVTLGGSPYVEVTTNSEPNYLTSYYGVSSLCYSSTITGSPNSNLISSHTMVMDVPLNPNASAQTMNYGAVGVAINGVAIYDNQAAPGDDIYLEAISFDACQGHPDPSGIYHYHAEPYAISYNDDHLIGVLRDGYFVYGRVDTGGAAPALDADGGHTGITAYSSGVSVYHYHVNEQTSTHSGTAGQKVWFLTTGYYHGTPGSCSGC